ncbi:diguanylate cyclase AdrA, partial [Pseudomonas ogarae]
MSKQELRAAGEGGGEGGGEVGVVLPGRTVHNGGQAREGWREGFETLSYEQSPALKVRGGIGLAAVEPAYGDATHW